MGDSLLLRWHIVGYGSVLNLQCSQVPGDSIHVERPSTLNQQTNQQNQMWSVISVQQTTFLDVHYEVWDIYISTVVCPDKVIRCIFLDYEGMRENSLLGPW